MSKRGRFEHKKSVKKNRFGKHLLILVVSVLLTVIAVIIIGVSCYHSFLDKIPRAEHAENSVSQEEIDIIMNYNQDSAFQTATVPTTRESLHSAVATSPVRREQSEQDILNIMVIGQSARDGEEYHMADTMILVTVNTFTKTMTLTSFLRDTYLKLPDYKDLSGRRHSIGMQRLNLCYHLGHTLGATEGAMEMLNQCVEENFGVEVDFDIEVGFEGVEKIINYLGGVEVELTQAEADYLNADDRYVLYDVQAGPALLDGLATLSYVRMRNAEGDGGSDIRRTGRQRVVLEKLMQKIKNVDAAGLQQLMNAFMPFVVTNMSDEDITRCILKIFPIVSELKIETGTCPVRDTYWAEILNIGGYDSNVIQFDALENRKLMTALTEGN